MNTITFELKDSENNEYKVVGRSDSTNLIINDAYISSICEEVGIKTLKHITINLGVNNMALIIRDYTLTDTVYIGEFYDIKSNISIFQVIGTNIHMTGQTVQHLQADCKSILLADCNVEKLDIGAYEQHKRMMNGQAGDVYKVEKVDFRDLIIGNLEIYAECKYINIQGSKIDEFNNNGNMFKEHVSTVKQLHLWQNTSVGKLSISNRVIELKIEDSTINRLLARSKVSIEAVEVKNSIIENCYGFKGEYFKIPTYESWRWVRKSAGNEKDLREKAEADYQMTKLLYKTEKKGDRCVSGLFDFCAGYGYKPLRIIRASGLVIFFNAIIFSFISIAKILSIQSIPVNMKMLYKGVEMFWNNLLMSFAAFAGQSSFTMSDGLIFWFAVMEYLLGVILFAMFVNALYVRYKE